LIAKYAYNDVEYAMLKDTAKVILSAGFGGDGRSSFTKGVKKYPDGGNGGKGGDLYVVGTTDYQDLKHIDESSIIKAQDGEKGGLNRSTGENGRDFTLKLPVLTEIYDPNGKLMHIIKEYNKPYLMLKGGQGGLGNYHFRKGFEGRFDHFTKGKKPQRFNATLIFKLIADIIFIGLPNAGKSSMLNALTNANAKVGAYPFTTINPHLGRMGKITLMDLPGLIEGTYEGKGLGTKFLKHTEYAKLVSHFISLDSDDLLADYKLIRNELKNIDKNLESKPEVIILTKADNFTQEEIDKKAQEIKSLGIKYIVTSSIDDEKILELKRFFEKNL
jgi:GTP-binding protein